MFAAKKLFKESYNVIFVTVETLLKTNVLPGCRLLAMSSRVEFIKLFLIMFSKTYSLCFNFNRF